MSAAEARQAVEHADALAGAGEFASSLAEADRAISLEPSLADGHTQRGWALENLGSMRLLDAREAYETALQLDPDDLWAVLGLATVLTRLGESESVGALYRRVVAEAPDRLARQRDLAEALGWAQYRLGMHSAARETLRRYLEGDPNDVAVRLDLALVLLVAGDRDRSLAEFRRAIGDAGPSTRGHIAVALDDLDTTLTERPGLSMFGGNEARAALAIALGRRSDRRTAVH
jgi:tetratricopeptide (TPR) repeat protein